MKKKLEQTQSRADNQKDNVRLAIEEAMGRPKRDFTVCRHVQPKHFNPGEPLDLKLSVEKDISSVRLYYRHVNHAERYEIVEMQIAGKYFRATIPSNYTDSQYPLQYYFELKEKPGIAWLYPGFTENLTNQPYFVVRKT